MEELLFTNFMFSAPWEKDYKSFGFTSRSPMIYFFNMMHC